MHTAIRSVVSEEMAVVFSIYIRKTGCMFQSAACFDAKDYGLFQIVSYFFASAWMTKLSECLGFNLTDTLTSNIKSLSDFF